MAERERVTRLVDRREPDSIKIARLEVVVDGIRDDVSEIKATLKANLDAHDHRISYLEDVRVTGLEEREIRQNAIADERARAADAAQAAAERAAAEAAAERKLRITRRDLWATALLLAAAAVIAALIGAHII